MKKTALQKLAAVTFTIALCAGSLAGCGNSGDTAGADNAGTNSPAAVESGESGSAATERREPLVIKATLEGNPGSKDGRVNEAFEKLMSEKLNRDVVIEYELIPGSEYGEKAALLFATGDFGDLIGIPFLFDYSKAANEGFLLDIAPYKDLIPNYWEYMEKTSSGIASVTDSEGHVYNIRELGLPRFPEDSGMLPQNLSMYRADIFEEHGIKIPETLDEVYDAAKKLKEIYPDVYPINSRWNDLRSLFCANHVRNDIYWNGEEYVLGLYEEGYKDAITFANKLYSEGLLDPEYITDDDDMLKSKEMNDKTFIMLADWFTTPGEFTRLSTTGQVFAAALLPSNPKYGEKAWQYVENVNQISVNAFSGMAINADTKDPEGLLEFLNHCFDDDVIRLITWGIEGDSYTLDENGQPRFVDDILNADDPWSKADEYGMRASKNMRPGIELCTDAMAYVGLASDDWLYYDGEVHQEPIEQSPFYLGLPAPFDPENPYIAPDWTEPTLQFDTDTSQENSQILTAFHTVRDEWEAALVSGTTSLDQWDAYMEALENSGNIQKLLDNYNAAADEYFAKKAEE